MNRPHVEIFVLHSHASGYSVLAASVALDSGKLYGEGRLLHEQTHDRASKICICTSVGNTLTIPLIGSLASNE